MLCHHKISSHCMMSTKGLMTMKHVKRQPTFCSFLWRDLSSDFNVLGPYFTLPCTMEAQYLHSLVTKTMLLFHQYDFHIRCLLCDGASSNLSLLKTFCGCQEEDNIASPWFLSPFDGRNVYLMICPSHQVHVYISNIAMMHVYYS